MATSTRNFAKATKNPCLPDKVEQTWDLGLKKCGKTLCEQISSGYETYCKRNQDKI